MFFKGCPLNCLWCHNPESQQPGLERIYYERRCIRCGACVAACGSGAIRLEGDVVTTDGARCTLCGACVDACHAQAREIIGREMTLAEVLSEVERDVAFYDESGGGVTLSGGEPLAQPDFALALLAACRHVEIHTVLDTCGFASWEALDCMRAYVNLFLYDLKLMDRGRHVAFTGVSNEPILANLRALSQRGHDIVLRVPVIPGINDDEENVRGIGAFARTLPQRHRVDLLAYHHLAADKYTRLNRAYSLEGIVPPSDKLMARVADLLHEYDLQVGRGG